MTITSDPLERAESLLPPEHSPEELETIHRCRNAYKRARQAKQALYTQWRRNLMLLNNRAWSEFRMAWMPSPSDSEIYPICSNLIGWLTDQSIMFTIQPSAQPNTPWAQYLEQLGDDLEVLMESNWKVRGQQGKVSISMWDAALFGVGIIKAVWDQSLEKGMGDADLVRVDPWNFYPDPGATNEEDGEYYVEVRRMSWEEVERRFPETCDRLLSDLVYDLAEVSVDSDARPTNTKQGTGQYPMSMMRGYPSTATSSGGLPGQAKINAPRLPEGIILYEMWTRENRTDTIPDPHFESDDPNAQAPDIEVTYDDWKVIVYCSNTILLEAWASDLWEGATHPYGRFVLEDTGEFWPTALVSHLAPGQIAINRLLAALQQSAELTGNPIFVEPASAGISQSLITNRPGQRLRVNPMSMQQGGPSWMQPPQMSPDVLGLIRFWIERMENISGMSTISKGRQAAPRTPEAVVNQVQESGFVRVRSALRNLERTLRRLGAICAQLMVENYTQPRTISILGPEGSKSAVVLRERHFIDAVDNEYAPFKYALMVNAGSEVPTSRTARISEAQTLFTLKAIDRAALLEAVNFPHWPAVEERMKQQDAQQAQMQANMRQRTGRKS